MPSPIELTLSPPEKLPPFEIIHGVPIRGIQGAWGT